MPSLGFKRMFIDYVREGSKTHTLRGLRARPFQIGDTCHCFYALRTKNCQLLGRWPCIRTQEAVVSLARGAGLAIEIDGSRLTKEEVEAFAWADGFRILIAGETSTASMRAFWIENNGLAARAAFEGQLIHWNFSVPIRGNA